MKTSIPLCFRFRLLVMLTVVLTVSTHLQAQDTLVPLHTLIYEVKLKLLNGLKLEGVS